MFYYYMFIYVIALTHYNDGYFATFSNRTLWSYYTKLEVVFENAALLFDLLFDVLLPYLAYTSQHRVITQVSVKSNIRFDQD